MEKQDCQAIQAYLYEQIPLSKAMEVQVLEVTSNLLNEGRSATAQKAEGTVAGGF
jgi:hypothetical protein